MKTMEQVFTNKEHGSSMMKSLSQLWKNKRYCDAVLEIGSEKLEVSEFILVIKKFKQFSLLLLLRKLVVLTYNTISKGYLTVVGVLWFYVV